MKVIIIKSCAAGKVNDVIDVADGYAKNFLIKQGFALPINAKTESALANKIANEHERDLAAQQVANVQKGHIEKLHLVFSLNVSGTRVHGSVSKKELIAELAKHGLKIDARALAPVHLDALGLFEVIIKLHPLVIARLRVEVKANG